MLCNPFSVKIHVWIIFHPYKSTKHPSTSGSSMLFGIKIIATQSRDLDFGIAANTLKKGEIQNP